MTKHYTRKQTKSEKGRKRERRGKSKREKRKRGIFEDFARTIEFEVRGFFFWYMGIMYWYVVGSMNTYKNPNFIGIF